MKKIKKVAQAINSNALAYLKSLINPENKVLDLHVRGKWLTAYLSSGVKFSVKNKSID
jgi:hypothetical protein